jgi:hypothetical protein
VFETEAGGAQTTTYECRAEDADPDPPADAPDPQEACLGPQGGAPIAFAVPDLEDPTLDVTIGVTNVIVPSDLLSVDVETLGPVPPGSEFEVTIDCNDEVLVTPSGMTTTTVHRFDSGGTLLDPLPLIAGVATCTVEETKTAGALAVRYSTSGAGGTASGDVSASEIEAPPTLQVDSAGAPTTVVVTNVYGEVPLSITKTVSGPAPPGTTFEITVMCASPSASPILAGSGELVDQIVLRYNGSGQPIGHDGVVWTFGAGTCTITERDHGGAASFAYSCNQLFTDLGAAASCDPDPRTSPVVVRVDRSVASVDVEVASTFVAREQVAPSTPAARSAVATPLDAMPRFAG